MRIRRRISPVCCWSDRWTVPETLQEPLVKLVRRCVDVCEKSSKIIEELDELLEMGFRGREATQVENDGG